MKIKVEFTLDVPKESLEALRALAGDVDTNTDARAFVIQDAGEYSADYLDSNGVTGVELIFPWER